MVLASHLAVSFGIYSVADPFSFIEKRILPHIIPRTSYFGPKNSSYSRFDLL